MTSSIRTLQALTLAFLFLIFGVGSAMAQEIGGRIAIKSTSKVSLAGVVMETVNAKGAVAVQAKTAATGEFRLAMASAGTYSLRAAASNFEAGGALVGKAMVGAAPTFSLAQGQVINGVSMDFQDASLPIELSDFTADVVGTDVTLDWTTASETNNAGFSIELAIAGSDFAEAGYVAGAGTTIEATDYSTTLPNLTAGQYMVRLRQIDFDGTSTTSPTVEFGIDLPSDYVFDPAYPNPFNPTTTLTFGVRDQQNVSINMYDITGRLVSNLHRGAVSQTGTNLQVQVDASALPSGTYLVRMQAGTFNAVQTLVLMK